MITNELPHSLLRRIIYKTRRTIMAFEFINKLPTPAEIKEQFPLPAEFVALNIIFI